MEIREEGRGTRGWGSWFSCWGPALRTSPSFTLSELPVELDSAVMARWEDQTWNWRLCPQSGLLWLLLEGAQSWPQPQPWPWTRLWALQKSGTLERDSVAGQPDHPQQARWGHLQSGEQ